MDATEPLYSAPLFLVVQEARPALGRNRPGKTRDLGRMGTFETGQGGSDQRENLLGGWSRRRTKWGKRAQESTKVSIRSEGRVPPAALMAELGKCFDREAKLLGLNNPDKVENEEIKPIQIIRVREALLGRMGRRSMTKIQRSCKLVPTSRQAKTRLNVRPHPPPFCNNRPSPSKSSRNPSLRTGFFRPHNEDLSCGA